MRHLPHTAFASASILALALMSVSGTAHAQVPQEALPQQPEEPVTPDIQQAAPESQEGIVVTGTRIRTQQYDAANPVVSVDAAAIQDAGVTNLTEFLTENPALVGSYDQNAGSGTNSGIGGTGLNLLNLRNLGTNRTLVLVDGRRHVAAVPGSASIDINTIPVDLIERVDVLTGGASAIYGADAVTGVVNLIMRRDFEGLSARMQAGISEYGDNGQYFAALTAGTNLANGRGNIAVSGEYGHEQQFLRNSRSFLTSTGLCGFYFNQTGTGPTRVPECDVRYFDSHPRGAVDTDLDFWPDFSGDGLPWDEGRFVGQIYQVGGSGTAVSTYSGDLAPRVDRYVANLLFNYDITNAINFYAQGKYARVDSHSINQPTFDFYLRVRGDNPFMPASIREAMESDGAPDYGVIITGRDNFDLGRRGEDIKRETYRSVVGFDVDLARNLNFDVSWVYGRSDVDAFQSNTRYNDRFYAALDAVRDPATGNIVCRSNIAPVQLSNQPFAGPSFSTWNFLAPPGGAQLSFTPGANSGCLPLNIFSEDQNQAAIDWIMTDANDVSRIQQHVATAVLSGNFGDRFRLWSDAIGFAVGTEYRWEKSESTPDPINTTFDTFGNQLFPSEGSFDVKEAFAELRLPIASNRPFLHDFTLNGAVRVSDYSTVGTTWTYQVGGMFAPVRDIRFRGTYSQAVRAPNIGELFAPAQQTFAFFNDPCSPANINRGTANRAANCQALLTGLGLSQTQLAAFTGALSASIPGTASGNLDLSEETARTLTGGVVLQPRFIPGLTLAADYYDVRIRDAVATPAAQVIAELCVDEPTISNVFCAAVDRLPGSAATGAGTISGFRLQPQNVAEWRTSGIDFAANYRLRTRGAGIFNFRLVGNWLERLEFLPLPGGNTVDSRGVASASAPKWQVNLNSTWQLDQFRLTHRVNYFSPTFRFSRQAMETDPDLVAPEYLRFSARLTHDFQAAYDVTDRMTFYGGVNNAFGQRPDIGATWYPVSAVGRFIYFGARVRIPEIF
jgi:iron complex outermembrane recepter protein